MFSFKYHMVTLMVDLTKIKTVLQRKAKHIRVFLPSSSKFLTPWVSGFWACLRYMDVPTSARAPDSE
jgi:hypothetical protein